MENYKLINSCKESNRILLSIRVSLVEKEGVASFWGLSLDEEKPQDESFCIQGVSFIVDKFLLKQCGAINIDFVEEENRSGFKITSANPIHSGYAC